MKACLNFGYAEWTYYEIPKDYVEIAHLINSLFKFMASYARINTQNTMKPMIR